MKNRSISVVISAYNEEQKLARCLASVSWADEIIVVDNTSQDKTVSIAKKFTGKVYSRPNDLMLNKNKNFGFSKATSEWILNLDADEEVTDELKIEIAERLGSENDIHGYWIPRKNIIFGKWITHGLWWPDKQLRLFRKDDGTFPCVHIHEYVEVNVKTADLKNPYIHHNYDSVSQYLTKLERCTTSEAEALVDSRYHLSWYDAVRFPASDFIKIYFAQEGYKDGLHGLVLALFQAFYSFVVFSKVWEKTGFFETPVPLDTIGNEGKRTMGDFSYWYHTSLIKKSSSPLVRFVHLLQRKFRV